MHDHLLAWEAGAPAGSPDLVVVSSGAPDATSEEGFASRTFLDSGFEVGGAFGVGGTPAAVRVNADGNVASLVASGADAVFALLGVQADVAVESARGLRVESGRRL